MAEHRASQGSRRHPPEEQTRLRLQLRVYGSTQEQPDPERGIELLREFLIWRRLSLQLEGLTPSTSSHDTRDLEASIRCEVCRRVLLYSAPSGIVIPDNFFDDKARDSKARNVLPTGVPILDD